MFQIISMTGDILAETDSPNYSKFNPISGAWIPANESDAECVVVDGKRCVIYGKPFAADSDKVVFVKKSDSAKIISELVQDSQKISADNLDIMEAVVELDKNLAELKLRLEELNNA